MQNTGMTSNNTLSEVKFTISSKGQIQAFEYRRRSARWFRIGMKKAEELIKSGAKVQDPREDKIY